MGNAMRYRWGVTGLGLKEGWDLFTGYLITAKLNQTSFNGICYHRNQVTIQIGEPNMS